MDTAQKPLTVVFLSDRWMLCGLHVALASLLFHANKLLLHVIVFSDKLTSHEKHLLQKTALTFGPKHVLEFRELSIAWPEDTPSFHGNLTTNAKIFLAQLLPDCDLCLYLDCDLIVLRDVADVLDLYDKNFSIAANMVKIHPNFPDYGPYTTEILVNNEYMFNAGVFFASLAKWRESQIDKLCMRFFSKYSNRLQCGDQPVLNMALHGNIQPLDASWNMQLTPSDAPQTVMSSSSAILHLIGIPKPWYPLGCLAHKCFPIWWKWFKKTSIAHDPASLAVQFLTPRRHHIDHFCGTLRLIRKRFFNKNATAM